MQWNFDETNPTLSGNSQFFFEEGHHVRQRAALPAARRGCVPSSRFLASASLLGRALEQQLSVERCHQSVIASAMRTTSSKCSAAVTLVFCRLRAPDEHNGGRNPATLFCCAPW